MLLLAAAAAYAQAADHQAIRKTLETAIEKGDGRSIHEAVGRLLELPSLSIEELIETGGKLAESEQFTEAERIYERCRSEYPAQFEPYYNLALTKLAEGKSADAAAVLEGAPRGSPQQEIARKYLSGKIWDSLGQSGRAEPLLAEAFLSAPDEENYAVDLGIHYLRKGAYRDADRTFQKGLARHPKSSFLLLGLAITQALSGEYWKAAGTCQRLLAQSPGDATGVLLLAYTRYMSSDYEGCEKEASAGLASPNPHAYLHYVHAVALQKMNSKDHARIIRELTVAAGAIPDCSLCYAARSKAEEATGDENAAIADLRKAVSLDPEFAQGWYRLGRLYEHAGNAMEAQAAMAHFRAIKAIERDREAELFRRQVVLP